MNPSLSEVTLKGFVSLVVNYNKVPREKVFSPSLNFLSVYILLLFFSPFLLYVLWYLKHLRIDGCNFYGKILVSVQRLVSHIKLPLKDLLVLNYE